MCIIKNKLITIWQELYCLIIWGFSRICVKDSNVRHNWLYFHLLQQQQQREALHEEGAYWKTHKRPSGIFSCSAIWVLPNPTSLMIQQQECEWSQICDLFRDFHHFSFIILACDEERSLSGHIQDKSKYNKNMKGKINLLQSD